MLLAGETGAVLGTAAQVKVIVTAIEQSSKAGRPSEFYRWNEGWEQAIDGAELRREGPAVAPYPAATWFRWTASVGWPSSP